MQLIMLKILVSIATYHLINNAAKDVKTHSLFVTYHLINKAAKDVITSGL